MTNPAEQNPAPAPAPPPASPSDVTPPPAAAPDVTPAAAPASPLEALGVDLSSFLGGPGTGEVSIDSGDFGASGSGGMEMGGGADVSFSAPGGIPQFSAGAGAEFAAEGQSEIHGSGSSTDAATDAQAGTSDLTSTSGYGGIGGYGGTHASAEVGVDFQPVPGGIPEIGFEVGGELGGYGGYEIQGGGDHIDAHSNDFGGDFIG